jgi:hypothetical protein
VFFSAYGLTLLIHAFDNKPIQTSAKPFGLELTAERLCGRVDELRASSRVEKLGAERLAEGSNGHRFKEFGRQKSGMH